MAACVTLEQKDIRAVAKDFEFTRHLIFKEGMAVNYNGKQDTLKVHSLVRTCVCVFA
jgi:hypothetical protein